jgi:hypothetical protein
MGLKKFREDVNTIGTMIVGLGFIVGLIALVIFRLGSPWTCEQAKDEHESARRRFDEIVGGDNYTDILAARYDLTDAKSRMDSKCD